MGCIYQAKNLINGKCYVGKTVKSLNRRVSRHVEAAKTNSNSYFHNAIRKYGLESFQWVVLYQNDDELKLLEMEREFINLLNTKIPNGYNLTDGGQGMSGHIPSLETRIKLHKAQLGNTKGSGNKGRKVSEETKEKMKGKRKPFSEAARKKLSVARTGHIVSETTRKKISAANTGKKRTKEAMKRSWETRRLLKKNKEN
ncbi:MAG: hypothetical protein A2031_07885 [Deltaproteobacteria bacterium RBG_19FT_COMBO_43_11]|nr:MAG: hypothetical protein A2W27_08190 [Deltaproteobacteria bacterium RBG_16_44_11]OGP87115.1 MAG: hypothetical protein A2031_07885 [Deltaproteobacteria bacterium RBG_19FT_COMBO_43_11]